MQEELSPTSSTAAVASSRASTSPPRPTSWTSSPTAQPEQDLVHVPKIYLPRKTFQVDEEPRTMSGVPTVKTFIAGVGVER